MTLIYDGHSGVRVRALAWSPDSARIASASRREEIYLSGAFNDGDWLEMRELQHALAQSRTDGRGREESGDAQIWDATTGETLVSYNGHPKGANDIAWSRDGRRVASAGGPDGTVQVWEADDGHLISRYLDEMRSGQAMLFLRQAMAESSERHRSGLLKSAGDVQWVQAVEWTAGGERIVFTCNGVVQVREVLGGHLALTYGVHRGKVQALTVSPDGDRAASANGWLVHVWDAAKRGSTLLIYRGHADEQATIFALAWSPDGAYIASGGGKGIHIWDAASGETRIIYRGHSNGMWDALAWSPDSMRIASGGREGLVQVWDARTGERYHTHNGHSTLITAVGWSPDGTRIASADRNGQIHIWQVD